MNPPTPKPTWWPYGLIAYFVLFIAAIAAFITFALRQDIHLVRSDYYRAEVAYQGEIDRQLRGSGLGPQAAIEYDARRGQVGVKIPATHAQAAAAGEVSFYRPNDPQLDHTVALAPGVDGRQYIDVSKLAAGSWRVRLSWQLGEIGFAKTTRFSLVQRGS